MENWRLLVEQIQQNNSQKSIRTGQHKLSLNHVAFKMKQILYQYLTRTGEIFFFVQMFPSIVYLQSCQNLNSSYKEQCVELGMHIFT